jgi:hypothetical protein
MDRAGAQSGSGNAAKLKAAFDNFAGEDAKLRADYRELVALKKKIAGTIAARDAAKAGMENKKLPRDARNRNGDEFKRLTKVLSGQTANLKKGEGQLIQRQDDLLAKVNQSAVTAITDYAKGSDIEIAAELIRFTGFFIFDTKHELSDTRANSSFSEQPAWRAAAEGMGKIGAVALPELKKALETNNAATRYAAVVACGVIGPECDRHDKQVYLEISNQRAKLRSSILERTEKDRRMKLFETALGKIRSAKE